jgi:hypothetical protein
VYNSTYFLVCASSYSYIPINIPTDATCDRFLFSVYMWKTLHVSSLKRSSSGVPHRTYSLQFLCLCLSAALSCKKVKFLKKTVTQTDTNTETGGYMYGEGLLKMSAWRSKHVELYTYRQKIKIYYKLHMLVYLLEYMKMHGPGNIKNPFLHFGISAGRCEIFNKTGRKKIWIKASCFCVNMQEAQMDYRRTNNYKRMQYTYAHYIITLPLKLNAFFWVIPWRLNFIYWRFGTLCSIFIGG